VTAVHRLLAISLAFTTSCKGKPKAQPPPADKKVETPTEIGSATASPNLALPHGTGLAPIKTTKPVDVQVFDRLAALKYPGFLFERRGNAKVLELRHETADHPKILMTARISACDDNCVPMDLAKWKAAEDRLKLKQFLSPELRAAKDTVFEIGVTDLHGTPMIYTYQLGMVIKDAGAGGMTYTDMYVLYYNDGTNMARVESHYTDDPLMTKEDLARSVPKDDLEKVTKAFMDAYTQAWAP
jgi:hypothetical protein